MLEYVIVLTIFFVSFFSDRISILSREKKTKLSSITSW